MLKYSKIIIAGSLVSTITLILIVLEKYSAVSHKPGFVLNIILSSLFVYAVATPLMLYLLKLLNIKGFLMGAILQIGLLAELCLWVIIFHGTSALPSMKNLIYFFIPFALFIVSASFCLFLPSRKDTTPEK